MKCPDLPPNLSERQRIPRKRGKKSDLHQTAPEDNTKKLPKTFWSRKWLARAGLRISHSDHNFGLSNFYLVVHLWTSKRDLPSYHPPLKNIPKKRQKGKKTTNAGIEPAPQLSAPDPEPYRPKPTPIRGLVLKGEVSITSCARCLCANWSLICVASDHSTTTTCFIFRWIVILCYRVRLGRTWGPGALFFKLVESGGDVSFFNLVRDKGKNEQFLLSWWSNVRNQTPKLARRAACFPCLVPSA